MSTLCQVSLSQVSLNHLNSSHTSLNKPEIRSFPSGLVIIAEQIPVPSVSFDLWMNVGSAMEADSINGMAHFLEHMIFKGTDNLPCGEFERRVEAVGASLNASTSQDYTHYYFTCAPQYFVDLVPLQIQVVTQPKLPAADFEQERQVVLEEILRSEDNPDRRVGARKLQAAFHHLPYRRPILGPAAVIEQLQVEQMRSFHDQWYQAQNMTIAVVGNQPAPDLVDTILGQIPEHFLSAPSGSNAVLPTIAPEALHPEPSLPNPLRYHHQDTQLQEDRLILAWRVPGLQALNETYPLDILASVLAQGRTSRLVQRLREKTQWVRSISAYNSSYRIQGLFSINAKLAHADRDRVEAAIWEEIHRLQTEHITPAEFQRIRTQVANRFVFGNERSRERASLYGYYQTMLGGIQDALTYPQAIAAVTPQAVQAAAQRYLAPSQAITLTFSPDRT